MASSDPSTPIPPCPYGAECYRKNPQHRLDYSHPGPPKPKEKKDDNNKSLIDFEDSSLYASVFQRRAKEFKCSNGKFSLSNLENFEKKIRFRLPHSYIQLLKHQNGGTPVKSLFSRKVEGKKVSIEISSIRGIAGPNSNEQNIALEGQTLWTREWGYPKIGLMIGDCPSGGHDIIMLDYRKCKKFQDDQPEDDERPQPSVVHVDQEADYRITKLADTFYQFIHQLINPTSSDSINQSDDDDQDEDQTDNKNSKKLKKRKKNEYSDDNEDNEDNDDDEKDQVRGRGKKNSKKNSSIAGKKFCLTGALSITRAEATIKLRALGAQVVGSVTKNVDILVAAPGAGSKLTTAEALGIQIWDEDKFAQELGL